MDNVKPLIKATHFSNLWPKRNWFSTATAIMHNVPASAGEQKYTFFMKEILAGSVSCTLVLQPTGVVMFLPSGVKIVDDRVAAYLAEHRGKLRDIASKMDSGDVMLLVGKITKLEGRETFVVYYVTRGEDVFLDPESIRNLLNIDLNRLTDYLYPMWGVVAEATVSSADGKISFDYVDRMDQKQTVVGLPVAYQDERGYNETPVLKSTARHMNFQSFTVNGANRWPKSQ